MYLMVEQKERDGGRGLWWRKTRGENVAKKRESVVVYENDRFWQLRWCGSKEDEKQPPWLRRVLFANHFSTLNVTRFLDMVSVREQYKYVYTPLNISIFIFN